MERGNESTGERWRNDSSNTRKNERHPVGQKGTNLSQLDKFIYLSIYLSIYLAESCIAFS